MKNREFSLHPICTSRVVGRQDGVWSPNLQKSRRPAPPTGEDGEG